MSGPYFKGQMAEDICGCYYPDIILLGDNTEKKVRIYHCVQHGEITVPFEAIPRSAKKGEELPLLALPSDEWRESERIRLKTN